MDKDITTGSEINVGNTPSFDDLSHLSQSKRQQQFADNMAFFKDSDPDLYQRYIHYTPRDIRLEMTPAGYDNLVFFKSDNHPIYGEDPQIFYQSQINNYLEKPLVYKMRSKKTDSTKKSDDGHRTSLQKLVSLVIDNEDVDAPNKLEKETNFMLMFGFGIGYQIPLLLEHSDIHHLVVIEPHDDMFYATLQTLDWESLYKHFNQDNHSLKYIVSHTSSDAFNLLNNHLSQIGNHNAVKPYLFDHLSNREIKQSAQLFFERFPTIMTGMGYFDDEQISLAHSVANYRQNIPILKKHALIDKETVDYPVLMVANGPSLDKAVDFLQQHQNKAIIFSCGTALGSLIKMGVTPDFHIEMERTRPVVEWIETSTSPEDRENTVLLCLNTVHPDVMGLFERKGMGMKAMDTGSHYLSQFVVGDHYIVNLHQCNPTVINAGMAFASALGFKDICLFGADLGFPQGGQHHSSLSKHYDLSEQHESSLGLYQHDAKENIILEGNFGGQITSNHIYKVAKQSLEGLLQLNREINCYNTSDGILIHGANPTSIEDISFDHEDLDKASIVDDLLNSNFNREYLAPMGDEATVLADFSDLHSFCDKIIELMKKTCQTRAQGLALLDEHHKLCVETGLNGQTQYLYSLIKGSTQSIALTLAKCLYSVDSEQESLRLFEQGRSYYQEFLTYVKRRVDTDLLTTNSKSRDLKSKHKNPS